ncbi:integrating conjugative element protein [Niveibacterium sp. 24ML]|uniref:integrating conjugative element protein n=1 Tax=Niveibacterium sp. 24ML TaxID=2985512 RepID=UPI00226F756B|nr:integrating conjugative element protein [Niveibacterium sp. 24ML]MCX9158156.1 integrating conjugative element protein [Niveibacterium sp. 24ML]
MTEHHTFMTARRTIAAVLIGSTLIANTAQAAPRAPRDKNSLLYYKIGGSESSSRAPNPGTLSMKLGLSGAAKLNYSCGKFDAQITIQNLMNNVKQWGTQLTNAVQAGIAALPMYIVQRAQPGLYEMLQTYLYKAEKTFDIALKSCEQMEQSIRNGGDPYEDYINAAKSQDWKMQTTQTADAVQAKKAVENKDGEDGMGWVAGVKAGGKGQAAVKPVRDSVAAGFQITMNRPVATPPAAQVANPQNYRLTRAFPTAAAAADWALVVLGDQDIATCSQVNCPAKGAIAGTGLLPRLESEFSLALTQMSQLANGTGVPAQADLAAANAPGVAVSRELVDALRAMPVSDRGAMVTRLAMEIAQSRVLDKALLVRDLMMAGVSGVPEVASSHAAPTIKEKLEALNKLIASTSEDIRIRRDIVSTTAGAIVEAYRAQQTSSAAVAPSATPDAHPLVNGRAAP